MTQYDYDLFVIGGGSGGVRAGRLVAGMGKRVGIAEESRFGGTCVVRGCVPKKLMVYASEYAKDFKDAAGYGWSVGETHFDWSTLIANKDREIDRLEGLYRKGLANNDADIFDCRAEFAGPHEIRLVGLDKTVTAEKILVAVGGTPNCDPLIEGGDLCITSDEIFDLETLPRSIIIAGGGYIAIEFANILHGMGVDVTVVYRGLEILRGFDMDLRQELHKIMLQRGIKIHNGEIFKAINKTDDDRRTVETSKGNHLTADMIMLAIGRNPMTAGLGLEQAGVKTDDKGHIQVDTYSRTNVDHVFAVGDVTNRIQLTPVAIHESMCFVESEYRGNPTSPDHDLVASAVFSQPEIGSIGMPEDEAKNTHEALDIYLTSFRPMKNVLAGRDERSMMKLIVNNASDRIVGLHILGPAAAEMIQMAAIAIKAGATKADFDRTMAVHPTSGEELVTMYEPSYRIHNGHKVEA